MGEIPEEIKQKWAVANERRRQSNQHLGETYKGTEYQPDALDHTVEGYVELLSDLKETQRVVSADFRSLLLANRQLLEQWAAPHIEAMNAQRKPDDQINITTVNERFLVGLAEPAWRTYIPTDPNDAAQNTKWDKLLEQFDEPMRDNLEDLRELHLKVNILDADEKLMGEYAETLHEHVALVRTVAAWRKNEELKKKLVDDIAARRIQAVRSERPLSRREAKTIDALEVRYRTFPEIDVDPSVPEEAFLNELNRLMRRDDKMQLERGLLMTDQMQTIVDQVLPSLLRGEPVLLVGETGGAKTALAEYIVRQYFGVEPEFISFYADVNSYQLMGKSELSAEKANATWDDIRQDISDKGIDWDNLTDETKAQLVLAGFKMVRLPGSTESVFISGPLVRAMESGRPCILDEINAGDPGLLKRLNKIMQLRPGGRFTIQEDSGREVVVKPGFCIIATANEKSKRYKGVDDLSVEFQNRFGANIRRVRYPDHDTNPGEGNPAIENDRLATAAVVDRRGEFPTTIDQVDFDSFVKACRLSQQMFAGTFDRNSRVDNVTLEGEVLKNRLSDGKSALEETVLAPRTMIDILRQVAGSHGTISIRLACRNFLDGIKNADDRAVLRVVLEHHGLLQAPVGE